MKKKELNIIEGAKLITKGDIVSYVHKTTGLRKVDISKCYDGIMDKFGKILANGDYFEIYDLCKVYLYLQSRRIIRNAYGSKEQIVVRPPKIKLGIEPNVRFDKHLSYLSRKRSPEEWELYLTQMDAAIAEGKLLRKAKQDEESKRRDS